jgi:hypothetical protein
MVLPPRDGPGPSRSAETERQTGGGRKEKAPQPIEMSQNATENGTSFRVVIREIKPDCEGPS